MKVKTSELIDAALDLAVALAKCEYAIKRHKYGTPTFNPKTKRVYETEGLQQIGVNFRPSTDWAQGGPIIEREGIELRPNKFGATGWTAWTLDRATKTQPRNVGKSASSPLIAAMRCYVASKLGDTVDIPEELL